MEQHLDATYLGRGPLERAAAVAFAAAGVGFGVLLAAWGMSFFWCYTPPEIAMRLTNPKVLSLPANGRSGSDAQTASGAVIKREVTVFSQVRHAPGTVVTGWNYKDGSGGKPTSQFCYYTSENSDRSSRRVDLSVDGIRWPGVGIDLVPDMEGAASKCQWWQPDRPL